MLEIIGLQVEIEKRDILKDFNLSIKKGEIHIIMGPNGVGKSTLAQVLAGYPVYNIKKGEIIYDGMDLSFLSLEERVQKKIFVSFQNPPVIENISMFDFFYSLYHQNKKNEVDKKEFEKILIKKMQILKMRKELLDKAINLGFSGGEKKKNEILQMEMLSPNFIVLDEIDAGLDIDSLKIVSKKINNMKEEGKTFIVITHCSRILDYIDVDKVHIIVGGKIIKSGGAELAYEMEKRGYEL
ncbi:MAG: hypothetical protein AMS24_00170 [Chlamydiae bacterium SM23_39]|nr:MAG: hypothetical protein AMS24_00170 [Chlamydiae bacterium SM23_39]